MHLSKYLLGLAIVLASQFANAIPVSGIGSSGLRGASVSATLYDDAAAGVDSLQFSFVFDPVYLTYVGTSSGALVAFDTIVVDDTDVGIGIVLVAMASSDLPVTSGAGSLVELLFTINLNAPFSPNTTNVVFTCSAASTTPEDINLGCVDYAFEQATATIEILRNGNQVPLPGTLALVLLGLAGVAVLCRKA